VNSQAFGSMNVIRWIGAILGIGFITFLVLFAVENHNKVALILPIIPGGVTLPHVSFFKVVYVAVFLGFVSGMFFCWISGLKRNRRTALLQQKNEALEQELKNLRNMPFEGELGP
jgi:hypothetical protein